MLFNIYGMNVRFGNEVLSHLERRAFSIDPIDSAGWREFLVFHCSVKFSWKDGAKALPSDDWQSSASGYRCKVEYRGRSFSFDYWHGSGIRHPPRIEDAMHSLMLDAEFSRYPFEEFCDNLGYDQDSRRAMKMYRACQKTSGRLMRLFGPEWDLVEWVWQRTEQ